MNNLKAEILYLIRNSDIFSKVIRGVTTETETETLDDTNEYIINKPNVKNIRSIKIGTTELDYGKDYTIDLNQLDETIKTKITFNSNQTGNLEVIYDFGTDKIWPDFPRGDLTINSYPRISMEEISKSTEALSLGGKDFISSRIITIIVYSEKSDYLENTIDEIEKLIRNNAKNLYYAKFINPTGRGPIIKHELRNQTILQKNIDLIARFEVEEAN